MKVSLSWLREYVPVDMTVSEMCARLTMAGLETDSVTDRYAWLNTVTVGRISSLRPHPNADKLRLCEVELGDRSVRAVCGAPNVRKGMLAPLALPGTEFPNGRILEKSIIRGESSEGMLCSEAELELGTDSSGLMELPQDLLPGTPLPKALNLSDAMIEVDLTPNRPDCLSIIGVAREIGAFQGKKVALPKITLPVGEKNIRDLTSVSIASPDHCPRYAARLIEGIKVKPSPLWLRERLQSVGLRAINNIVDVTNFVMMEMGQPLHAFDFDNLAGHRIAVRTASEGEKFTTLDGKERTLTSEMLMICDGEKPVAVGGVMGGLNSEIENTTTRVLIESAYFNPVSIRKTAKKLGLGTDASHRFERGVDPDGTIRALDRAAQLMLEVAGGTLIKGCIDEHPVQIQNSPIRLSVSAANRHLGLELGREQMAELLESVEFAAEKEGNLHLRVTPPSFRVDVSRPEDLMEEIARLWGYDNIPVTFPAIPAQGISPAPQVELRSRVRDILAASGFAEVINYSFIDERSCDRLGLKAEDPRRRMLKIINPISEEMSVMRTSLIPGLLETMSRNLSRQNRNLKLFEIGKIFLSKGQDSLPDQPEMLCGLWTGNRSDISWHEKETPCDFCDLKGITEGLFRKLGIGEEYTALPDAECNCTRPGYTARISARDQKLGIIGQVHPRVIEAYDLKQTAWVFELDMEAVRLLAPESKKAVPLPRYPAVSRDITLILEKRAEAWDLLKQVRNAGEELVEDIFLFDVYEGKNIPQDKKSISFRIVYRSSQNTLEDETVSTVHRKISDMLVQRFKATFPA
ncbi:MAG: phenylalanine--tRNA ligase subunit beta [Desulfobacterales bacterium]